MDEVAKYNTERWNAMVQAGAIFTRPWLDLTPETARERLDWHGWLGDLTGKRVLCLASGGGQQSMAFALLGANVTVTDLSEAQLERDREAAAHYGLTVATRQADMRDLSALPAHAFDLVYHPYSINFVPEARAVFAQVARVLAVGGHYDVSCANPVACGLIAGDWDGTGYPLRHPYLEGVPVDYRDEGWVFQDEMPAKPIGGPREYRHTLSTLINGLIENGFVIKQLAEETLGTPDVNATPGTIDHLATILPIWLNFWAEYQGQP